VETSTGGLLTAALAGRSGASRYFRQARFAYDAHAKTSLAGGALPGRSAVSPEAVAALAQAMREAARTDFALAESGMAGPPDGERRSLKNGLCWFACAGPGGTRNESLQLNPFLTRREHQLRFSLHALDLLRRTLAGGD
jgi:PncC family amidohydrolase